MLMKGIAGKHTLCTFVERPAVTAVPMRRETEALDTRLSSLRGIIVAHTRPRCSQVHDICSYWSPLRMLSAIANVELKGRRQSTRPS